jgi:threonine synthase
MITLATAHPVKFADAVTRSGLKSPDLPVHMQDLFDREERYDILDNSIQEVTQYLRSRL